MFLSDVILVALVSLIILVAFKGINQLTGVSISFTKWDGLKFLVVFSVMSWLCLYTKCVTVDTLRAEFQAMEEAVADAPQPRPTLPELDAAEPVSLPTDVLLIDASTQKVKRGVSYKTVTTPNGVGKIYVWQWRGGSTVRQDQLYATIVAVLDKLPQVRADKRLALLLLETAAVESDRGIYVQQVKGPAKSIYQMEPATIVDTLAWVKTVRPDVYTCIQGFWDQSMSVEDNLKYNVPYMTALATTYYWRCVGGHIYDLSSSRESRATLHRLRYNSLNGASSVKAYMAKTDKLVCYTTIK